jgi:hypothetical protein
VAGTGGDEGSAGMMRTVVWVASFVAVFALLSGFMMAIHPSNDFNGDTSISTDISYFNQATLATYTFYNTSWGGNAWEVQKDMYCYNLKSATAADPPSPQGGDNNTATFDSIPEIRMYMYSWYALSGSHYAEYNKSMAFKTDSLIFWNHAGIIGQDNHYVYIPFKFILGSVKDCGGYQQAKITIQLDRAYTVFVTFDKGDDVEMTLESQEGFSVAIARSITDIASDSSKADVWTIMLGVLTFNVDTGNDITNMMIIIPVGTAYLFIGFWAITRLVGAFMP